MWYIVTRLLFIGRLIMRTHNKMLQESTSHMTACCAMAHAHMGRRGVSYGFACIDPKWHTRPDSRTWCISLTELITKVASRADALTWISIQRERVHTAIRDIVSGI